MMGQPPRSLRSLPPEGERQSLGAARRHWRLRTFAAIPLLLAFAAGSAAQPIMPAQRQALNAAERWLEPVDAERYANAWAMASQSFKASVSQKDWRDGIRKIRKDYGRVVKRTGEKMAFRGQVPSPDDPNAGTTPGTEVSIIFSTKFAGSKQATEEMTMVLENDGIWRVAGYFIK
jgi:hypothetical protein